MTTCVPGCCVAQSCRVAISDYSAALVARTGVMSVPCVGAHDRAISDYCGKTSRYNANDSLQTVVS